MTNKLLQEVNLSLYTGVSIGLTDPKGPTNVGAVMRAAGCFAVDRVLYTGIRYQRAAKFHTDTKRASDRIPLLQTEDLLADYQSGRFHPDTKLICVDLIEGGQALPEFEHPKHALYIFGPEDGTIGQAVIDQADAVVYVPTHGCLNLAASVNVLLYDRLAKDPQMPQGDELIRSSRDTNNRVKVIANVT